jgi:hypothetical protein
MNREDWKKDANAQRKTIIFGAVVAVALLWVWYGGAVRSGLRDMRARKPSPVVRAAAPAPVVAAAPPPPAPVVVAAPPVPPPSPEEVMQAQIAEAVGPTSIWGGFSPRPNLGPCALKISLTAGADKGSYSADSSISCASVSPFRPGQRSSVGALNTAQLEAVPVNAVFSGVVKDGAIVLTQTKALNFSPEGCNLQKLVLTPFVGHLDATWEEAPKDANAVNKCGGGHVTLSRTKTF